MKIILIGARGMLGSTLMRRLKGYELHGLGSADCDIRYSSQIRAVIQNYSPDVIINCSAMTRVDDAETEVDLAYQVNALGCANLAIESHRAGVRLISFSTDYVFDGNTDRAYHEWDSTNPINVYGASKLQGEEAIRTHCPDHLILRISWLYGREGKNFYHTMSRLGQQGDAAPLKVVDDQWGNPTSCEAVADYLPNLLERDDVGTMHLSCDEEVTWYGFARAIFDLKKLPRGMNPCSSAEYPTPCPRPRNTSLDNRLIRLNGLLSMPTWHKALESFVEQE